MANNNFKCIEEFVDGFTKTDPRKESLYDDCIYGLEFSYRGKAYRITRDQTADDATTKRVREIFGKPAGYIEWIALPCEDHHGDYLLTPDIYLGIFDDVDDLLDNGKIDGVPLREILVSGETFVFSID